MHKPKRFETLEAAIADVLRCARLKRKLKSWELAQRMGCHKNYIGKVERGTATPRLVTLARFAQALDTPAWNLLRCAEARLEQSPKTIAAVRADEDKRFEAILAERAAEQAKMPTVYLGQVPHNQASQNPAARSGKRGTE